MLIRLNILILIICHSCSILLATEDQQQQTDSNENLIKITASPMLPSASGIDEDQLEISRSFTSDTASLFQQVLGVSIQTNGGVSGIPVIRGLSDDRIRLKVDGMDLISACGNHMNPPLSYIDPTQVESAMVFAGITPVSQGGDSLGSSIIVQSKPPEFASTNRIDQQANIGLALRSNGQQRAFNLGYSIASDDLSLSYQGSLAQAGNYQAGADFKPAGFAAAGRASLSADEVGSSQFKSINHRLDLAWQKDEHLWRLQFGLQDIPYQSWVNQRMDMTANDSNITNLSYEGNYNWGKLEARLYAEDTRHGMQFFEDKLFWYGPNNTAPSGDGIPCTRLMPGPNGCAAGMPMDTAGENRGFNLLFAVPLEQDELIRFGAQLQRYQLDDWWQPSGKGMWPNTFWNINNGQRDRNAVFVEWQSQLAQGWQTQVGVRYESVAMNTGEVQGYNNMMASYAVESQVFNDSQRKRIDDNFDITAVIRNQVTDDVSVEFGYGRQTRSPNLYERYSWSTGAMVMRMINFSGDGNGYVGNLDLLPEVAHSLNFVMDWQASSAIAITVSPHYTQIDNAIDVTRCQSTNSNCGAMNQQAQEAFVYLQFRNSSARIFGVDMALRQVMAESTAWGDWNSSLQLSYNRGKNRDNADNLYHIMPLTIKITADHNYQEWQSTVELQWVDSKDQVASIRNELATPAYTVVNLRSSYQFADEARLVFGIENLFDRFYVDPLAGTYLGQGKTMAGNAIPWGMGVPAKGRNLYLGIDWAI